MEASTDSEKSDAGTLMPPVSLESLQDVSATIRGISLSIGVLAGVF